MADFEVNKRLKYLIENVFKTSALAFSAKYNDNRGVKTSQILRERNGVSSKMIELITDAYPEINRNWLLTGEGEMLKNTESPTLHNSINRSENNMTPADNVVMSREVFEQITKMTDTILSQQATIKELTISIQNLTSKI